MASSSPRTLTSLPELQPPDNETEIRRSFEGFRLALAQMTPEQLMGQLTTINAALEAEARTRLAATVSEPLSAYIEKLDRVVLRSTPSEIPSPSPRDRGDPRFPSRQPSPLDLLASSARLGPRLAAKLVVASARSRSRSADE